MKKQEIKRMFRKWAEKRQSLKNDRGASEVVAVVALIIVVLVIVTVVFLPDIKNYIDQTVMPGLAQSTKNLFDYKG